MKKTLKCFCQLKRRKSLTKLKNAQKSSKYNIFNQPKLRTFSRKCCNNRESFKSQDFNSFSCGGLTWAACLRSLGPPGWPGAGSRCERSAPTSSSSVCRGCLRTEGPTRSDTCLNTRTTPRCQELWRFSQAGRSYRDRGRKALKWGGQGRISLHSFWVTRFTRNGLN